MRDEPKLLPVTQEYRLTLVNDIAHTLMEAFFKAEPESNITKHPVSFIATFADMARAVVDEHRLATRTSPEPVENGWRCHNCKSVTETGVCPDRCPACHCSSFSPVAAGSTDKLVEALKPIFDEMTKAVAKFPTWPNDPLHAFAVLNEEVGELDKALMHAVYEPEKGGLEDVRMEATQAAAMALRFFLSLEIYEYLPGKQHLQKALVQK